LSCQFLVFGSLANGSHLGHRPGGHICSLQVGASRRAHHRHVPAQWSASLPWNKRQTIRPLAICPCQATWLPDDRYIGRRSADEVVDSVRVNLHSATALMRDANSQAKSNTNGHSNCFIIQPNPARGYRQSQQPITAVREEAAR